VARQPKLTAAQQTAQTLISELPISSATTFSELIAYVESAYGKPIRLRPVAAEDWGAITGLFLDTPTCGLIYYRANHPLLYQLHNIYHELGHILLRGSSCNLVGGITKADVFTLGIRDEVENAFANGVVYDDPDLIANEQEAEAVAYQIARKLRSRPITLQTEVFG
jgi:hypothetical protein